MTLRILTTAYSPNTHCLRHPLSFPPRRQKTAHRPPIPAAFIVGAPDDDDDKHPPRRQRRLLPAAFHRRAAAAAAKPFWRSRVVATSVPFRSYRIHAWQQDANATAANAAISVKYPLQKGT